MTPETAETEVAGLLADVKAQTIFGETLRNERNSTTTIADLLAGRGDAADLSLKQRDALVSDITGELNRQHATLTRNEANDRLVHKTERETAQIELWDRIYSGDPERKPTTSLVKAGVAAGIYDADEGQQMLHSLATDKVARNDIGVVGELESLIASGTDVRAAIADHQAAGRLAPEVAADPRQKNVDRQNQPFPDAIEDIKRNVDTIYTLTGGLTQAYDAQEQSRKVSALQFFDETVRAAQAGVDPETGLSFRELAARKAFEILEIRERERKSKVLRKVLPRSAFLDETDPKTPKLRLAPTIGKLRADEMVGLITPDERRAEFRLIEQWERAGLTVRK
jgi:hypothetical protein